jgi:hypothetical protein
LNGLHPAPVVHERTAAPRLAELAAPLLHQGGIAVEQEPCVGLARLHGVLAGLRACRAPHRSVAALRGAAKPCFAAALRLLLLRLQASLTNLLDRGPKLRRGHAPEAQQRVHAGDGLRAVGNVAKAVCLRGSVGRGSWQQGRRLAGVGAGTLPLGREGGSGRVKMGRRVREVLVGIPVERGQVVVQAALHRTSRGLLAAQCV